MKKREITFTPKMKILVVNIVLSFENESQRNAYEYADYNHYAPFHLSSIYTLDIDTLQAKTLLPTNDDFEIIMTALKQAWEDVKNYEDPWEEDGEDDEMLIDYFISHLLENKPFLCFDFETLILHCIGKDTYSRGYATTIRIKDNKPTCLE